MFFSKGDISAELLGVFKIDRKNFRHQSVNARSYDSLSIRLSGSAVFAEGENTLSVKKGDIIYVPQSAAYRQTSEEETVIAVHFINYSRENGSQMESLTVENSAYATELFCQLYDIWKEKKQGYQYRCMSLFYELLYFLHCQRSVQFTDRITHENEMNIAMDYIHSNYRKGTIEISKLAKMCAVSETYFRKLFHKIHGVSPQQYIINLRLEFAYHLLGSNLYSVNEVSRRSGFQDAKYFSRMFKKRYGCSPRERSSSVNLLSLEKNDGIA